MRRLPSLEAVFALALVALALSVGLAWLRAPADLLIVAQAAALGLMVVTLYARRRLDLRAAREREERDEGLTRLLQGLSRSVSSQAIVEANIAGLLHTARADHVVVIRGSVIDGRVQATLVSANPEAKPSTIELPRDVLDQGTADAVAAQLARRMRSTFGLANPLAAPLIVDDRMRGALVLSRRSQAWTAADRRLLGWAAQEVSAALARAYAFEEAASQAKLDPLTGLPNRRFLEELVTSVGRGRRARDSIGALMIDIDHFKLLNDRHGHAAGDDVLRAVADRIAAAVRASDTPARYGGEEFAVVLRRATLEEALEVGERIRRAVALMEAADLGVDQRVTVSVGVAVAAGPEIDIPQLLDEADRALYRAKREGRNRVVHAGAPRRPSRR